MKKLYAVLLIFVLFSNIFSFETITFPSKDKVEITADIYVVHPDSAPFIILFHRAHSSRGEYREIAPKLNEMGFNCMAIDQRSGNEINGVQNETIKKAQKMKKGTNYLDAIQDMEVAVDYAKENFAKGKLILWGSSYSASLVLKLTVDYADLVDGVLAFAPGEYFSRFGKSENFIKESAKSIKCPVFITSAKSEKSNWIEIYEAVSAPKSFFLPKTKGVHGSEALWKKTPESKEYWEATRTFLRQFVE